MQTTTYDTQPTLQRLLRECPLPGTAPLEIHGASAFGNLPDEEFLFQGFRYVLDAARDVLVREDVYAWLATHATGRLN